MPGEKGRKKLKLRGNERERRMKVTDLYRTWAKKNEPVGKSVQSWLTDENPNRGMLHNQRKQLRVKTVA